MNKPDTVIMYAKPIVDYIKQILKLDIEHKVNNVDFGCKYRPQLHIICNRDNDASLRYVKNKQSMAADIGISTSVTYIDNNTDYDKVIKTIKECNNAPYIHGIIVQLPLPERIKHLTEVILDTINPMKDVDGLTSVNKSKLGTGKYHYVPCTPKGILTLMKQYNIPTRDKSVVILGRSDLVGRPLARILSSPPYDAMVTLIHSKISDQLRYEALKNADIIISATGVRNTINAGNNSIYSPTIIDVGINVDDNGKLCGDVAYNCVVQDCHAITPVPGGVGPMTVISLMENVHKAWHTHETLHLQ